MHISGYNHKTNHDDVIKWKHFPRYWPFVRGIHRSPVNSPHKGQGRGALMFSLICVRINDWVNNRQAGDLRRYRAHYDVILMQCSKEVDNLLATSLLADSFVFSYRRRLMVPEYEYSDYPREVSGHPGGYGWMPTLYLPKVGLPRHRSHRDSLYFCQYVLFFSWCECC